jgi:hypothetical protein
MFGAELKTFAPELLFSCQDLRGNGPLIDVSLFRSTSLVIVSPETEVTFTSPVSVLRSTQPLSSAPPLRETMPTVSTFMNLSALNCRAKG